MEIKKFNEYMNKFDLVNVLPKDIGLLTIIESLLDSNAGKWKKRDEGCFIVPPWLYSVKDSFIVLCLGEKHIEIQVRNSNLLSVLGEQKPYIRITEKGGIFEVDAPLSNVETRS